VPHPPEKVFRYLADPRNRPEWQSSLLSVKLHDRGEPHVGMTWRDNTMAGVRPVMRITELTPYRLWAEEGTWHGITATLVLHFTAITSGTRVDATGTISGEGIWTLPVRAAGRLAGPAIRHDLSRVGDVLTRAPR
jgi:uncharacterized protein YndB with AHSA1/START domain